MLSIIGPSPYDTAKKMESTSKEADFGRESKEVPTVASHTNEAMENNANKVHGGTDGPFILNNLQQSKEEPVNGFANGGIANDTARNGKVSVVEMHL